MACSLHPPAARSHGQRSRSERGTGPTRTLTASGEEDVGTSQWAPRGSPQQQHRSPPPKLSSCGHEDVVLAGNQPHPLPGSWGAALGQLRVGDSVAWHHSVHPRGDTAWHLSGLGGPLRPAYEATFQVLLRPSPALPTWGAV